MTAPATAQAPVAPASVQTPTEQSAPVTPVETLDQQPKGVQNILDKILKKPLSPEAQAFVAEPVDQTADSAIQSGIEGAVASQATGPTDTVPPVTEAPSTHLVSELTAVDEDGQMTLRARDPKTGQFSEMDSSRTYELSLKGQDGETRVYNKTLPELMRMAKDGVAMQKSRDELAYYRKNAPEWTKGYGAMRQELEAHKQLAISLLTEPEESVVMKREAYAKQFTPESRAQQLERENQQLRQRLTQPQQQPNVAAEQTSQHVQALTQRIGSVVAEVEGLVGKERATGKLALELAPLYVNGRIPVERFAQLEQYVHGPFKQWAQAEAAKTSTEQQAAAKQLEDARRVQQNAQLAARNTGSAMRSTPAVNGNLPAPEKPAKTLNDRINRIVQKQRQM